MAWSMFALVAFLGVERVSSGDCVDMNYCNGHGTCETQTDSCDCPLASVGGLFDGGWLFDGLRSR